MTQPTTPLNPMDWLEALSSPVNPTSAMQTVSYGANMSANTPNANSPMPHWLARAQANQSQPAAASNNNPPANPFQRNNQANQANQAAQPNPQGNANQPNQQNQGGSLLNRSRPGLGNQERVNNPVLPLGKTIVRFELNGLGDPFYRLLGHDLNSEMEDGQTIARLLEQGGESVKALEALLEKTWESYDVRGAMLVYRWQVQQVKAIQPQYIVPPDDPQNNPNAGQDDAQEDGPPKAQLRPNFQVIRAIDLALVLNVLARARTQLLLAKAPLIFNQGYLNRVLCSDDPRLVALARATGAIQEGA